MEKDFQNMGSRCKPRSNTGITTAGEISFALTSFLAKKYYTPLEYENCHTHRRSMLGGCMCEFIRPWVHGMEDTLCACVQLMSVATRWAFEVSNDETEEDVERLYAEISSETRATIASTVLSPTLCCIHLSRYAKNAKVKYLNTSMHICVHLHICLYI